MSTAGWVKLHRQIRESSCYNDPNPLVLKVWLECLLCAVHTEQKAIRKGAEITLGPGEFLFSRTTWARRLQCPESTLRNVMKKLEKWDSLEDRFKDNGTATVYKVKSWENYQDKDSLEDRFKDSQRTGGGQVEDTYKNDKNDKNAEKAKNTTQAEAASASPSRE